MSSDLESQMAQWKHASKALRLRIYPEAFIAALNTPVFTRVAFPGLRVTTVLDLPTAVALVGPEYLPHWEQTAEDVFKQAFENALECPVDAEIKPWGGADIVMVTGDHMYTTAHALAPRRYLPNLRPAGAIIALPDRDCVLFHALGKLPADVSVMQVADMVRTGIAMTMQGGGDSVLTRDLFWWRPGEAILRIGAATEEGVVKVIADNEVMTAMKLAVHEPS